MLKTIGDCVLAFIVGAGVMYLYCHLTEWCNAFSCRIGKRSLLSLVIYIALGIPAIAGFIFIDHTFGKAFDSQSCYGIGGWCGFIYRWIERFRNRNKKDDDKKEIGKKLPALPPTVFVRTTLEALG